MSMSQDTEVNTLTQPVKTAIDGVQISDLIAEFDSPLFVYSEQNIRNHFRSAKHAFTTRYPNVTFGWSYKTNYLKAICAILHQEGAVAEVVSKMEYEKAKILGIPGQQIIFNGPHKPYDTLLTAITEGATINIDHYEEIADLEKIATSLGRILTVGMRVNLNAGVKPYWSRFGFNLESGQAMEAAQYIHASNKLRLNGLHSHIGTFIMEAESYAEQVEKLIKFGYAINERFGFAIDYLDVGGGFSSINKVRKDCNPSGADTPSIDEYVEAICNALVKHLRPDHRPQLIIESGRFMVEEAGSLITSVCGTKRLPDGTPGYVLDAGIHLLCSGPFYRFDIALAQDIAGPYKLSKLYGPLCANTDVIDDAIDLPALSRGDCLVISRIGAYNNSFWSQFIEYRPYVVLISEQGKVEIIRTAEDLSDFEKREVLPPHLELKGCEAN